VSFSALFSLQRNSQLAREFFSPTILLVTPYPVQMCSRNIVGGEIVVCVYMKIHSRKLFILVKNTHIYAVIFFFLHYPRLERKALTKILSINW
jgi:hypothetical protein